MKMFILSFAFLFSSQALAFDCYNGYGDCELQIVVKTTTPDQSRADIANRWLQLKAANTELNKCYFRQPFKKLQVVSTEKVPGKSWIPFVKKYEDKVTERSGEYYLVYRFAKYHTREMCMVQFKSILDGVAEQVGREQSGFFSVKPPEKRAFEAAEFSEPETKISQ